MADSAVPPTSIDPREVAKFSAIAAECWDPAGKFAPLHKFNPVRLAFIRGEAAAHLGRDPRALHPFEGLSLLDIGHGGAAEFHRNQRHGSDLPRKKRRPM